MKTFISNLAMTALIAGAAMAPAQATPQSPAMPSMPEMMPLGQLGTTGESPLSDSEKLQGALEKAAEAYRQYKWAIHEDMPDETRYTRAADTYTPARQAIDLLAPSEPDWQKMRGMLSDIASDLLKGAFHFSNKGDNAMMTRLATAYVETHLHPALADRDFSADTPYYPSLLYCAASGAYNSGAYADATRYFDAWLATGEQANRDKILMFASQAASASGNFDKAISYAKDGCAAYPSSRELAVLGVQACVNGRQTFHLQEFLDKALSFTPDDEALLNIQARLHESTGDYQHALEVYKKLDALKPDNLSINSHIAQCYYNQGVSYYNSMILEKDDRQAKKLKRLSDDYFEAAVPRLEAVLATDPSSMKHLTMLARTYGCLGRLQELRGVNDRILAFGGKGIDAKEMPAIMADDLLPAPGEQTASRQAEAPHYADFARAYVEPRLQEWAHKGEYEKNDEYLKRVDQTSLDRKEKELLAEASREYLTLYTSALRLSDISLGNYDPENETYLILTSYGNVVLPVPLADNQAQIFRNEWSNVKLRTPEYYIDGDSVKIASISFTTPQGRKYSFDNNKAYAYTGPTVTVTRPVITVGGDELTAREPARTGRTYTPSDVDINIPVGKQRDDRTFAVIIANENYSNTTPVEAASHDGAIFAQYCEHTLGLPKNHIRYYPDATLGDIHRALADIRNITAATGGQADVIFYYAGHGMPDEQSKSPYILPVDGDPKIIDTMMSLDRLYKTLSELDAKEVMVFMDACFSGMTRDVKTTAVSAARAVAVAPKAAQPAGNLFTLSAASGSETALPYQEKSHGLFTYFLLKKLQETKGKVTLGELTDYITRQVTEISSVENGKPQHPQYTTSGTLTQTWRSKKLRP